MAIVKGIMVLISTRNIDNAGTDGSVYLGLGGREFHVDSSADDFERNSKAAYIFGEVNEDTAPYVRRPVSNPQFNDPRGPFHLYTENLDLTPAYLRWEQGGNNADWSVDDASAWVFSDLGSTGYFPPAALSGLWLGDNMGKVVYLPLKVVHDGRPTMSFDDVAAKLRAHQVTPL